MNIIELIEENKTPNGGWTKEFLSSIGIDWPPRKGWYKRLKKQHLNKEIQLIEALVSDDFNNDNEVYGFPDDYNNSLEISQNGIMRIFGTIHDYNIFDDDVSVNLSISEICDEYETEMEVLEISEHLENYGIDRIKVATRIWGTKFYFYATWDSLERYEIEGTTVVKVNFKIDRAGVFIANTKLKAKMGIEEMFARASVCWNDIVKSHKKY